VNSKNSNRTRGELPALKLEAFSLTTSGHFDRQSGQRQPLVSSRYRWRPDVLRLPAIGISQLEADHMFSCSFTCGYSS
jgi:hypothetical protein